jgi:CBS domain-containing protein
VDVLAEHRIGAALVIDAADQLLGIVSERDIVRCLAANGASTLELGFMDRARVLAAWCELRQDFRTFRTDRIIAMTPLNRYPGRRADLARRLHAHLDCQANDQVS